MSQSSRKTFLAKLLGFVAAAFLPYGRMARRLFAHPAASAVENANSSGRAPDPRVAINLRPEPRSVPRDAGTV